MAKLFIKDGVVRTANTAKRESQLKVKGYVEFNPKKATTPKPTPTTETK